MTNKAQNSEEVRQALFDIFDEVEEEEGIWQESTSETANNPEPKFQEVEIDGDIYEFEQTEEAQTTDETDYQENEAYFYSDEQQAIEDELDSLIEDEYQATERDA